MQCIIKSDQQVVLKLTSYLCLLNHTPKKCITYSKDKSNKHPVKDISSYSSCQGSFIHLSCLCECLQPFRHVISLLHSHPSSACGSASKHFPSEACCLHFTAPLIDLASSVSWGDLHLGQSNPNPSLGCRSQTVQIPSLIIFWAWGNKMVW